MGKSGSGHTSIEAHRARLAKAVEDGTFTLMTWTSPVTKYEDGVVKVDMESRELPDFTPAVNRGAQLLDTVDPEWFMHIDTSSLNLDDENMCVLGQSWNHYKVIESAVANDVSSQLGWSTTNFGKFLHAIFDRRGARSTKTLKANEAADHGFAFSAAVYSWLNIEARRRVQEGELKEYDYTRPYHKQHCTWAVDDELWEHLTKTWLVVIEARQKAKKKADDDLAQHLSLLTSDLRARGFTDPPARELAEKMIRQGITNVADVMLTLASNELKEKS